MDGDELQRLISSRAESEPYLRDEWGNPVSGWVNVEHAGGRMRFHIEEYALWLCDDSPMCPAPGEPCGNCLEEAMAVASTSSYEVEFFDHLVDQDSDEHAARMSVYRELQ